MNNKNKKLVVKYKTYFQTQKDGQITIEDNDLDNQSEDSINDDIKSDISENSAIEWLEEEGLSYDFELFVKRVNDNVASVDQAAQYKSMAHAFRACYEDDLEEGHDEYLLAAYNGEYESSEAGEEVEESFIVEDSTPIITVSPSQVLKQDLDNITLGISLSGVQDGNANKVYKSRLFLGEADFSYTRALIKKHANNHPGLMSAITATEYLSFDQLEQTYGEKFKKRIKTIEKKGVVLHDNIDAREIDSKDSLIYNDRGYKRIHFNFPHDRSKLQDRTLPKLLLNFFESAANIQKLGDRVHIALPKPADSSKRKFYEGYVYNIFEASAKNGYILIKKHKFGADRYPGYKHSITDNDNSAKVAESAREYVFEKTNKTYKQIIKEQNPSRYKSYDENNYILPNIGTDDDSTDYEDHLTIDAKTKIINNKPQKSSSEIDASDHHDNEYTEDNMRDLLEYLLPDQTKYFISPQTQFEHNGLLEANINTAIQSAMNGKIAVIPINLHNNHWVGVIIRRQQDGNIQVIYVDPLGGKIEDEQNAKLFVQTITTLVQNANIIDLGTVEFLQQTNDYDCGPFTVSNLINLTKACNKLDNLSAIQIKDINILVQTEDGNANDLRQEYNTILVNNLVPQQTPLKQQKSVTQQTKDIDTKSNSKKVSVSIANFLPLDSVAASLEEIENKQDDKSREFSVKHKMGSISHDKKIIKAIKKSNGKLVEYKKGISSSSSDQIVDAVYKNGKLIEKLYLLNDVIYGNPLINNRELVDKAYNLFGVKAINLLLELGEEQDIAEQIVLATKELGIEKVLGMLFGDDAKFNEQKLLIPEDKDLIANQNEQLLETIAQIEDIIGKEALSAITGWHNYISTALANKSLSSSAIQVIQIIGNLVTNLEEWQDFSILYESADIENQVTILLTQLEHWIDFVASGITYVGLPPRYPDFDPDYDFGSGNSGDRNDKNHDQNNDINLLFMSGISYENTTSTE